MQTTSEIWIAEDDRSLRWVMEKAIKREGIEVQSFENGDDLLVALNRPSRKLLSPIFVCRALTVLSC